MRRAKSPQLSFLPELDSLGSYCFKVQEITPSRNRKSGSLGLSFFHFLLQDQPCPEPSEQHKEMSPIQPEAGSNYQPLIQRHEDAEVLSSYRHMGVNLKSATNFNGRVHMPEGSASE